MGLNLLKCIFFFWQGHQNPEALLSLLDDSHYEATGGLENWLLRFAGLPQKMLPEYLRKDAVIETKKKKPAKKSVFWAAFDLSKLH